MKPINKFLLFLSLLSGCTPNKKTEKVEGTVAAKNFPVDTNSLIADSSNKTLPVANYKGFFITGDEVNTFRSCTNNTTYWVEDESGQLKSAYQKAKGNLSYAYESVYAEIKGYLKGKASKGYASEYTNVLVVTEVTDVKQKSFLTDCFDYEFIALGTEPFWALEIIPSEKIIAFKDVSIEKSYVFPYKKPQIINNQITYTLSNDKKESLTISLIKENCNDGMSDRNYNYSAEILINKKPLTGCAIKKGDKLQ